MGCSRGIVAALVACAAWFAWLGLAAADEAHVVLAWSAPAECPDEAQVRSSVAQLLLGSSASAEARATVQRDGGHWRVLLTMNGGERRLEAESCRALADATALIVAMAVDPARVVANRSALDAGADAMAASDASPALAADASPALVADAGPAADAEPATAVVVLDAALPSSSAPASPVAAPSRSEPAESAPAAPRPPLKLSVFAAGALDLGTMPSPAFGPSLGVAVMRGPLRLELAAAYFPSSSVAAPPTPAGVVPTPNASVDFSLWSAAVRGCYEVRVGGVELGPCAGVEGGLLQAAPQNFQSGSGGSAPLVALDGGLLGAWSFAAHWAIFARGDALLQISRPTFLANGEGLQPTGVVTGRASAGVELRF